jgi:hypothetical protein
VTRGRGIRVSGSLEKAVVVTRVAELVDFARAHGYHRQDVIAMIEALPLS